MANHLHEGDLPAGFDPGGAVAVDTETMGLKLHRDRLCVVQVSAGDGDAHVVHFPHGPGEAPNLKALMEDERVLKIFHFARFDVAVLQANLGVACRPVVCTKIASKLARTNTDKHGLKDLCRDLLGVELSKQQQTSDWGAPGLTEEQVAYAASDVLHLHALWGRLEGLLEREGRRRMAGACFDFLPWQATLDIAGWQDEDIFAH